ncbi:hypothetical protein [Acidovorax sp.]|uniref:hypothetical protein n=1 Tax=Acidovorax sp. TaxID=1872122 RepID=UPI002ACD3C4F|nr:hypothetical protein [Acidovorax sp.]MDZ7864194.1 hypothetical protein [Acidovorax sp.]
MAQHQRQAVGQDGFELSIADLGVQQVHPRRMHLHQHLVIAQLRSGQVGQAQGALFAVALKKEGFHRVSLRVGVFRMMIIILKGKKKPAVCTAGFRARKESGA